LTDARFKKCKELMIGSKNVEYSRGGDKLHNFKKAGRIDSESPERALWGMFKKHLVSVQDIVNDIENEYRRLDPDSYIKLPEPLILAEKITDSINYFVLLEALITERIQAQNK
jgi:hypothetical protein